MRRARRILGLLTGGALVLGGCADGKIVNPLLLIDEPFVSPSEQAARNAERRPALAETRIVPPSTAARAQPVIVATLEEPEAALVDPPEASPPAPVVVAVPGMPVTTLARPASVTPPVAVDAALESAPVAAEQTVLIGPDFLPDEPPVPVRQTPAPAPATVAATPDAVLAREAASLGLSIAPSMPDPGERDPMVTTGASGYGSFYRFALERLDAPAQQGGRRGMLLDSPESIDPELKVCGNLPPAVLVDLDPGAGLLPLAGNDRADPGLATYLDDLRARGVTVYWISGHGPEAAGRIRSILDATGLDPLGADPIIVTRFASESKQRRRYALGETNCLLAIVGDQRADFDELYDFVLDPTLAAPLEGLVGEGWFLAPPPVS